MKRDLKEARKTAKELEITTDRAIAARQQTTSACWSMLGIYPGANYHEIKKGLNETLGRLNRENACVGEFRIAHNMAQECIQRLGTGEW